MIWAYFLRALKDNILGTESSESSMLRTVLGAQGKREKQGQQEGEMVEMWQWEQGSDKGWEDSIGGERWREKRVRMRYGEKESYREGKVDSEEGSGREREGKEIEWKEE